MAWIWVAAVNTVTKNRNVGGPRLTHHKQFVNCAWKPFDGCFDFVGERVQKQHLCAHFINGDHSHNVARTYHSYPHINTALAAHSAPPRAAVQERRQRCGSDLRSGDAAIDAFCCDQDETATDWPRLSV